MSDIRCPVCRADNSVGPTCRRCKADLSLLWQLEETRAACLRQAHAAALRQDWATVRTRAQEAQHLRRGADAEHLLAIACLFQQDFAGAWERRGE